MMTIENMNKKFPSYFTTLSNTYSFELPPSDAVNTPPIVVYRACPTKKIDKGSFLNSYEEKNFTCDHKMEDDPSSYSLSLYTKKKDLKRFTKINNPYNHPCLIAKGILTDEMGVWKLSSGKSSHVNFWQYENIPIFNYFEEAEE